MHHIALPSTNRIRQSFLPPASSRTEQINFPSSSSSQMPSCPGAATRQRTSPVSASQRTTNASDIPTMPPRPAASIHPGSTVHSRPVSPSKEPTPPAPVGSNPPAGSLPSIRPGPPHPLNPSTERTNTPTAATDRRHILSHPPASPAAPLPRRSQCLTKPPLIHLISSAEHATMPISRWQTKPAPYCI